MAFKKSERLDLYTPTCNHGLSVPGTSALRPLMGLCGLDIRLHVGIFVGIFVQDRRSRIVLAATLSVYKCVRLSVRFILATTSYLQCV